MFLVSSDQSRKSDLRTHALSDACRLRRLQMVFLQYQALLAWDEQSTKDNQDTLSLFFLSTTSLWRKSTLNVLFFFLLNLHNKATKNKVEMWWSSHHNWLWTPINRHAYKHVRRSVCARTHRACMYSPSFFFYLNKSIWHPKPQRSPMHGFSPRLCSRLNKLKALGGSQKKWETKRNRKRKEKQEQNNLSAPTAIPPLPPKYNLPSLLPSPILGPVQFLTWKETGQNDIMHMKMSRKMFDLCMH